MRQRGSPNGERSVVVDARMVFHSGVGTYIRNLVPRVAALLPDRRFTALVPGTMADGTLGTVATVACSSDIYSIGEQMELPHAMPRDAGLLWSPHYNIPLRSRIPLLVTVHDVAHLARPEHAGLRRLARTAYARLLFSQVRRRAECVLFVSESGREEFERFVGAPRRAVVVHNGVDDAWRSAEPGGRTHDRPYLLFVGSVKPHKNLRGLLRAFASLAPSIPHNLLVAGSFTDMRTIDTISMNDAKALGDRVRFLGRIDDRALPKLVANADALVFPSFYEGFGLPPLEAMAAGCPVVASSIPPVREVCGDVAVYFDPASSEQMASAIRRVVSDATLRARLIDAGRARAAGFTWDRAAQSIADLIVELSPRLV